MKKVKVGTGAKANHLAYLGDGTVGAGANIGAGTIFCNYDGFDKSRDPRGRGRLHRLQQRPGGAGDASARAPTPAPGSVITEDVAPDALALGRGRAGGEARLGRRLPRSQAQARAEKAKA